ncbi:MAG: hypothetical protein V7L01_03800 [Nostoc sp.]|uniref:hypothetical protein n=1 Tax=Nostoc sp. TaxID=1180 RepID=UPI002FF4B0E5
MFQPPHTPQVNSIERLWEEVKRHFAWESFGTLDELREFIWKRLEKLNTSIVASITDWDFIVDTLIYIKFLLKWYYSLNYYFVNFYFTVVIFVSIPSKAN